MVAIRGLLALLFAFLLFFIAGKVHDGTAQQWFESMASKSHNGNSLTLQNYTWSDVGLDGKNLPSLKDLAKSSGIKPVKIPDFLPKIDLPKLNLPESVDLASIDVSSFKDFAALEASHPYLGKIDSITDLEQLNMSLPKDVKPQDLVVLARIIRLNPEVAIALKLSEQVDWPALAAVKLPDDTKNEVKVYSSLNALEALNGIVVKPEETAIYNRDDYRHWDNYGRSCWTVRDQAIVRDSISAQTVDRNGKTVDARSDSACKITGVSMLDPYTGNIVRGDPAVEVDVDHVVALGEANRSGAATWTATQKRNYANDLNILASTSASVNRSKGDKDPAHWLPSASLEYKCKFVSKWTSIKKAYNLTMDKAEYDAVSKVLISCAN